ncbi:ABC transporter permease subunit, partial [Paenibacillus glucanolyticus]
MCMAPLFMTPFRLGLLTKFLALAILAVGLDLIWGYGGILSLGHGVFFGLGAYAMAMYLKLE